MKLSIKWLQRHIAEFNLMENIDLLQNKLLALGFEVEKIKHINLIESAVIIETKQISEKLSLCQVEIDSTKTMKQVVCGAHVAVGMHVLYAHIGTTIMSKKLQLKTICGFESHGMLLGASEVPNLGYVDNGRNSLIEITKATRHCDDIVIDVAVATNRWDLNNIRGIARQITYLGCGKLKPMELLNYNNTRDLPIKINNFTSIKAGFVDIQQIKVHEDIIQLCQNIDIHHDAEHNLGYLNDFVLLDIGHPIHIYDTKHTDMILIEQANNDTVLTLKGDKYTCTDKEILIKNSKEIISIGGIVGVKGFEKDTTNVLIEACWFQPYNISKLITQSAKIFHLSIDMEIPTLEYVCNLIDGDISKIVYTGNPINDISHIFLSKAYFFTMTGLEITLDEMKSTLEKRGFAVSILNKYMDEKLTGDYGMEVRVPSYRKDIQHQRDLIEELLLTENWNNIIKHKNDASSMLIINNLETNVKNLLVQLGFVEMYNIALQTEPTDIEILNPINTNEKYLRKGCLFQLLRNAYDFNKQNKWPIRIFEVEDSYVHILVCGRPLRSWRVEYNDFFFLKSTLNHLRQIIHVRENNDSIDEEILHSGMTFENNGVIGQIKYNPKYDVLDAFYLRLKITPVIISKIITQDSNEKFFDISITTNKNWGDIKKLIGNIRYRLFNVFQTESGLYKYSFTMFNRTEYNTVVDMLKWHNIIQ